MSEGATAAGRRAWPAGIEAAGPSTSALVCSPGEDVLGERRAEGPLWAAPARVAAVRAVRQRLLAELQAWGPDRVRTSCRGSKLVVGELAPGCRRCAEGAWSCLFITGRCNASCFFCPTAQVTVGEPETRGLRFSRAEDYADYLEKLQLRGASLSGGEPLLDAQRTLRFVKVIKRRLGGKVHLWLYTNGLRADAEILGRLRDAGLDEIRFNLAAGGYRLDAARLAASAIPTVTVEIPAVPGELARLRRMLGPLAEAGVRHLNLHQMRCTPHNGPHLRSRGLEQVLAPDPVVLGSEETALGMLLEAVRQGAGVGVHYCSLAYRSRFQAAAARAQAAALFLEPTEAITATGHIRRLTRLGSPEQLAALSTALGEAGHPEELWSVAPDADRMSVHPRLWAAVGGAAASWTVRYDRALLLPVLSYSNRYREISLNRRSRLVVERVAQVRERPLAAVEVRLLAEVLEHQEPGTGALDGLEAALEVAEIERIAEGLLEPVAGPRADEDPVWPGV